MSVNDDKKEGVNEYQLNINLNHQKVEDFNITIVINETLPLKNDSISLKKRTDLKDGLEKGFYDADIEFDEHVDAHYAKITYVPEHQEHNEWKFILRYDILRPKGGNEIQIGAGRFIHFYKPEEFENMVKHVIFVIDVSRSMSGRKLSQTSNAMVHILSELYEEDSFDILKFSDVVYEWLPSNRVNKDQRLIKNHLYEEAEDKMLALKPIGGTNINDSILKAINKANGIKINPNYNEVKDIMIIFLTDGEATTGVTDNEEIKKNVREANQLNKFPIFGLSFGNEADFDLIKDISNENAGFAKRIYESGTSFEQLENFYDEISDPKLRNAEFKYIVNGKKIPQKSLSFNKIDHAFGHDEHSIIGEYVIDKDTDDQHRELGIELEGYSNEGRVLRNITFNFGPCSPTRSSTSILDNNNNANSVSATTNRSEILCHDYPTYIISNQRIAAEKFMHKLWAFKRIKALIENIDDDYCDPIDLYENMSDYPDDYEYSEKSINNCKTKVIELAKKFHFLTKYTSLVVVAIDNYTINYEETIPYDSLPGMHSPPKDVFQSSQHSDYSYQESINHFFPTPSTPNCLPSKLILYSKTYFRGESIEIDDDLQALSDQDFDDKVQSINIEGCNCWMLYVSHYFKGASFKLWPREYKSAVDIKYIFKRASSVKKVSCY